MKIYTSSAPIREAELHAYADDLLSDARRADVEVYLDAHPEHRAEVEVWRTQNESIAALYADILKEPIPHRLPLAPRRSVVAFRQFAQIAMAASLAMVSGSVGWFMHAQSGTESPARVAAASTPPTTGFQPIAHFAHRAAVAHVVYSPEVRRPVEVGADHEPQLVEWLSKRLGTEVKPPDLKNIGYELIGGRLLPGESGPVAQFMYHDGVGQRLTLYVTREAPSAAANQETAFRFAQDGPVNVFYWVDKNFGYAISGGANRQELIRVGEEVHRQLAPT